MGTLDAAAVLADAGERSAPDAHLRTDEGSCLAPLHVPIGLVNRLEALAAQRGCSSAVLAEALLLQALEQAEALPSARCSTRLGRCSVGPVPLPYQQR